MYKRQELLDRIKAEQFHDGDRRPRTYTPRRRYTPSPLPPPSRRSLPDLSNTKHYHFGYAGGSHPAFRLTAHLDRMRDKYVYSRSPPKAVSLLAIFTSAGKFNSCFIALQYRSLLGAQMLAFRKFQALSLARYPFYRWVDWGKLG
ncbi:hypothetical protein ElyMa_002172700 [Elysia marginata]|uniref:Uncharacterized protein n=1 Tax=Elysia marginata TaxID=1093978 RepID=A0AAV4FNE2_9GAST|nr:hypothetical protein ElyMa_002172700 [Elysia marginata]